MKDHKRKFITKEGFFLDNLNSQPKKENLRFWGEWEAQSFYKKTKYFNKDKHYKKPDPNAIHKPIFIRNLIPQESKYCHSTDPYVFNKCHFWTHCVQSRPIMRNLETGTILLFGSYIADNFVLDEVFVVGDILEYKNNYTDFLLKYSTMLGFPNSEIFYHTNYKYINPHFNTIYKGEGFFENKHFFSFFPCKIDNSIFRRPIIPDHIFLTNGAQTQGVGYIIENNSYDENQLYWEKLVKHLIKEGYYLGLYADEPDYYKNIIDAQNGFKRF